MMRGASSNQLIKTLGLENSVDQNVKELSGGETTEISSSCYVSKGCRFLLF